MDHGEVLLRYAEALVRDDDDLTGARSDLIEAVGADAAGHTLATVTAFSGLVRVADATGIPIDDGLAAVSADTRDQLGLDGYAGAANSRLDEPSASFEGIDALFGQR
ncbi:MAG: hypothetical protein AAF962_10545 [Actinomycetota bacterium]